MNAAASRGRTGWPAVGACFLLALFTWTLGFYGQGVFLAELQRVNGWSTGLITAAATLFYLVGAVFMAFVPEAIERAGRRPALLGGIACLALSVVALPAVRSPALLFALDAAMGLGWALTSGTAITATLAGWFRRRRGLAISLALNGASAAGFTIVPLMIALNHALGFADGTRLVVGALALPVAILVVLLVRVPSPDWLAQEGGSAVPILGGDGDAVLDPRPDPHSRSHAMTMPAFWWAATPFSLGLMAQVGFVVHQVSFAVPLVGPEGAGTAVALLSFSALCGRIVVGLFVDRVDRRTVTAASFAAQAVAITSMLVAPGPVTLYAGSLLFGFSVGNAITLPALVVMDEFANTAFGLVVGLVTALNQFVYSFGPMTLGLLHDLSGGYRLPLCLCVLLELAAAATALLGRPAARTA